MAETMGTLEASQKWDVSQVKVREWCRDGKIPCAEQDKKGSPWHIPKDAVCPKDKKRKGR